MADTTKSNKLERYKSYLRRLSLPKLLSSSSKFLFLATLLATVLLILLLLRSSFPPTPPHHHPHHRYLLSLQPQILLSSSPLRPHGLSVLVTGAAGFIGSHCSLALRLRGDGVLGLDNFNSYYDPSLKLSRQSLLLRHSILILHADLNNSLLLSHLFSSFPFSHILHLAAQPGVRYASVNPHSYISSNIFSLVSLFESAAKSPLSHPPAIVWASSSSVYGLNTKSPFSESDPTDLPASLYAATKKSGEAIAHSYNHIYGLSLTALRFFTVYGPMGRPDMAYFSFTKSILAGEPITIFRTPDGRQVARDFTYIDDIVNGCLAALDTAENSTGSPHGGPKSGPAQFRIYNLGNTSPVPVTKLVSILEGLLGVKAKVNFVTMPTNGDVPFTHANISLAAAELGYRPTTDLAAGLRKFVKWYVRYYGIKLKRRGGGGGGGGAGGGNAVEE